MPAKDDERTLRKSAVLTVPGRQTRRLRRRKALPHELQLCWDPRTDKDEALAQIRALTTALARKVLLQDGRTEFGKRVSFEEARGRKIHGWYYFKEGFSPTLLGLILKKLGDVPQRSVFCDPFAGVATSVLAATQLDPQPFRRAVGVERNPFTHFVGNTKLRWTALRPERLRSLAKRVRRYKTSRLPELPKSATLRNTDIYSRSRLRDLRTISAAIDALAERGTERNALRLALASILEATSFAKKDGRALRIVDPDERKLKLAPRELFIQAVETIASDVEQAKNVLRRRAQSKTKLRKITARIYRGDARALPKQIRARTVGLALYSPPYLNGIDYSEVYKVEEYFLGFISSNDELRELRKTTLRSHASIRFPERESALDELPPHCTARRLIAAIGAYIDANETRAFQQQYAWLVPAYFADMYEVLREQARVLRPGGYAVCVVGNSMLAGPALTDVKDEVRHPKWFLPIASDLILAELARLAGLQVRPSWSVRTLFPRNVRNAWSRESILVFRRPI